MTHQRTEIASSQDQDMRDQILAAAQELFLARGFRGVSVKEIAEVVQVTHSALYYHFPKGKEELFTQMIRRLFTRSVQQHDDHVAAAPQTIRARLTRLTADLLALPLHQLPLLLRDAKEHLKDPEHQQLVISLQTELSRRVMSLFQAAQEIGELRRDLPVDLLVAVYLGALKEVKSGKKSREASQLVSVLLDGMTGTSS